MTTSPRSRSARPCPKCHERSRDGLLCPACTKAAAAKLRELAHDWRHLEEAIARQTVMGSRSEIRAQATGGPLPWNDNPSRVARTIRSTLWRRVRDALQAHPADLPDHPAAWCQWLAGLMPDLRREPDAHRLAEDVEACHRDLLRAIDYPDDRARVLTGRPCPERTIDGEPCTGRLVAVFPTDRAETPHIDCPLELDSGCGRTWAPQAWDGLVKAVAAREAQIEAQKARVRKADDDVTLGRYMAPATWLGRRTFITVADASLVYGIPTSTLYRWIGTGRIVDHASPVLVGREVVLLDPHQVSTEAIKWRLRLARKSSAVDGA